MSVRIGSWPVGPMVIPFTVYDGMIDGIVNGGTNLRKFLGDEYEDYINNVLPRQWWNASWYD